MSAENDAGPVYAEPVHACPPEGSGIMPCCGRTPLEVPRTDRMTRTERVTCTGVTPPAESDAPKPSWVRELRAQSNHDVTLYGGRSTPCFCWADGNHASGAEVRTRPIPPEQSAENDALHPLVRGLRNFPRDTAEKDAPYTREDMAQAWDDGAVYGRDPRAPNPYRTRVTPPGSSKE